MGAITLNMVVVMVFLEGVTWSRHKTQLSRHGGEYRRYGEVNKELFYRLEKLEFESINR